nr:hypothetical protein [Tanacetum cinerariifolium]
LSWKPCQGDSLNLPDHSLVPTKSNSYYQAINVKSLFGEIDCPKISQVKLKGLLGLGFVRSSGEIVPFNKLCDINTCSFVAAIHVVRQRPDYVFYEITRTLVWRPLVVAAMTGMIYLNRMSCFAGYGGEVATWVEMVEVVEWCSLGGCCGEVVVEMVMLVASWNGGCRGVAAKVVVAVVA